jgi:hypothetical protein
MKFQEERAYWLQHDSDKAPDMPFDSITVDGVQLISRYAQRHELYRMTAAVNALPEVLRRHVVSIYCDSKATHCYCVKLDGAHPDADAIGKMLSAAFLGYTKDECPGGHNGISIGYGGNCRFWGDVHLLDIDPDWGDYFDDM